MIYTAEKKLLYPKDATLSNLFLDYNLNNTPLDKPAIIDGPSGGVVYTYESLRTATRKFANHLRTHLNIREGTVVSILSLNTVHYPVYVHGILAAGGVVSAFNPIYQPQEIAHALTLAEPEHILVEPVLLPNLKQALRSTRSKILPNLHLINSESPAGGISSIINIEEILRNGDPNFKTEKYSTSEVTKKLAFICFSSGTSGLSKGVRLSHGNVVANIFQQGLYLEGMFRPTTVFVLVVPFFHILGLGGFTCQYLSQGAPVVVFPRFDLPSLLVSIKRDKVTHINIVPPIGLSILSNPLTDTGDFSSVRCLINAAAPLEQSLVDRLSKKLDCVVTNWYGMTEASPSVISQREDETHIQHTVGRLLPGMELRIVAEDGRDCEYGVPGELYIRGPNIMQGYVGPQKLTNEALSADGFLKTGDIGVIDRQGFIFLVDRAKEMIKVKGHQVAPAELEAILRSHPLVLDAAVCGIYSSAEASEIPIAYITTGAQQVVTTAEVMDFVNGKVASYKKLRGGVFIIDEIPRNPSGKILRRLLPANLAKTKGAMAKIRDSKL